MAVLIARINILYVSVEERRKNKQVRREQRALFKQCCLLDAFSSAIDEKERGQHRVLCTLTDGTSFLRIGSLSLLETYTLS
jgi:hypothetical protein